jgi:hypothetical protein
MLADLIIKAYKLGYELTGGDLQSSPVYRNAAGNMPHAANSLHYDKLAIDLNLFKNGVYLDKTEDHRELGEYWESIGGSWGGRFKSRDGNHYSLEHNGRR